MLALLTKYLVQYKRVSIPHIGTFEIVQHPPELHIADKLITAPVFITRYINSDQVTDHQFHFIASCEQTGKESLRQQLFLFGNNLKNSIRQSPFSWKGFGTLRFTGSQLVFDPQLLEFDSLKFVHAQKVTRENAQHNFLVGDQQMTTREVTDVLNTAQEHKTMYMIIGWIIFVLALAVVIIILFMKNFQISAAGLRW